MGKIVLGLLGDIHLSVHDLTIPVLRLAFRPFFLLAALFSVLALSAWLGIVLFAWSFTPFGGSLWWHAHEMLFGFTAAVVVGFLLTAVQTWTGIPSVKGGALLLLVVTWALPRILLAINPTGIAIVIIVTDMLFLPLAAFFLARPIIAVEQYRNLVFVPVLVLMTVANAYMHWAVLAQEHAAGVRGAQAMVWLVLLLMCIIGGRVFPMFTANATGTPRVAPIYLLEVFCLASVAVMALVMTFDLPLPKPIQGLSLSLIALAHVVRWARWRFWITWHDPLLWSLHLSYLCIPLGFSLYAAHDLTGLLSPSVALHTITVGAMGMMILSMMSRVSLGHSGRKIVVDNTLYIAFLIFVVAVVSRVVFPLFGAILCFLTKAFKCAHVGTRKHLNNDGEEAQDTSHWMKYCFLIPTHGVSR